MLFIRQTKKLALILLALGALANPLPAQAGLWNSFSNWYSQCFEKNATLTLVCAAIAGVLSCLAIDTFCQRVCAWRNKSDVKSKAGAKGAPDTPEPSITMSPSALHSLKETVKTFEAEYSRLFNKAFSSYAAIQTGSANIYATTLAKDLQDTVQLIECIEDVEIRCDENLFNTLDRKFNDLIALINAQKKILHEDSTACINLYRSEFKWEITTGFNTSNESILEQIKKRESSGNSHRTSAAQKAHTEKNKLLQSLWRNRYAKQNFDGVLRGIRYLYEELRITDAAIAKSLRDLKENALAHKKLLEEKQGELQAQNKRDAQTAAVVIAGGPTDDIVDHFRDDLPSPSSLSSSTASVSLRRPLSPHSLDSSRVLPPRPDHDITKLD